MSDSSRLKIHWGGAEVTPGTWYLGLFGRYERKSAGGRRRRGWVVSMRGLSRWAAVSAACLYVGGAAYVWQQQARRPHNEVTYVDMLLYPLRKDAIRHKRGRAMIADAHDALQAGRSGDGFALLRAGLHRYPHDLDARLLVVRFFLSARVRTQAQTVLVEGLNYGWPGRDYLETAINIVAASEDHELVIEICDRAIALHDASAHPARDLGWLHTQRIRATLAAGENEAVLAYLDEHEAALDVALSRETRLLALFALGRLEEASVLVEAWRASAGDTPQVLRLAARTYRENKELEKMEAALDSLRRRAPADPRARVYAIIQTLLAGRETEGRAMIDDFIFRFGGHAQNLAMLAAPLGDIGRLEDLDTVIAAATDRGARGSELGMIRLRALIAAKRWQEARAQVSALRVMTRSAENSFILDYYEAMLVALQDPARGAQSSFTDKVRPLQLSLPLYRQAIELLRAEGRAETARNVVTFAEGVFPGNPYLEKSRHELDAELTASELAARPVQVVANATLADHAVFFAALAEADGQNNPAVGLALIRDLRRARPEWLAAHQEAVTRHELTLLAGGDDVVALQSVARIYLNGDLTRAENVTMLARDLHEKGRRENTRLLLDEVLRRNPGEPSATRLRDVFFPPAEPAP